MTRQSADQSKRAAVTPVAPHSPRPARQVSPRIRSQDSRALALHSALGGQMGDLASSWSDEHVRQNAMARQEALEKELHAVQKELAKVAKHIETIDDLPDGDSRKEYTKRTKCGRCVDTCFGLTPYPKPCGSPVYQVQWIMSGVFIALVKYVFAITCALMVHESADVFESSKSVGVNVQLLCIIVSQFCLAPFTKIGVTVAGPDVVAAIFASGMAEIIAENTQDNPSAALPTLLLMMALTTFCCAVSWLLIGYLKAARIVDYLPVCVVCGFLGCLAYKVFYYAVKLSVGKKWYHPEDWEFWKLLLPIIPLGFGLYYLKKFHHQLHVNPIVLLSIFLFLPPAILFSFTAAGGDDEILGNVTIAALRYDGWLFSELSTADFWSGWSSLNFTNVDVQAVGLCIPSIFTTVIVVSMAFLITLQAAKQTMNMPEVDAAHEMKVFGWTNIIGSLFVAAPGYTQIKFTLLNFHILNNRTDKKPGLFAGTFALVMLLGGFRLINYLPRLTVGMLLIYAGLPLLEDNLIFSYNRVTKKEFVAIWVIVLVNAVAGVWTSYSFLIAVLTGLVLATIIFAVQYGRNPVIRDILSGCDYQSSVVRPYTEQRLVEKIGIRLRILELEGYLFFGSTIQILNKFKALVESNQSTPFPERVRYFICDFTHAKNIDHSSCLTFKDLKQIAKPSLIVLVFTGMNAKVLSKMRAHGVLPPEDKLDFDGAAVVVHSDLDHGAEWVEDQLLSRAAEIRSQWLVFDSFRKAHSEAIIKASCEAFEAVIGSDVGSNLWKYASLRTLDKGQILCRQGSINSTLYVLQEGVLTSFVMDSNNKRVRLHKMTRGAFINDECLILDLPVAFSVVANQRCVLWAIDRAHMKKMEAHDPHLAMEILRKVLRHTSTVRTRLEREVRAVQMEVMDVEFTEASQRRRQHNETTHRLGKSIIAGATIDFTDSLDQDIIGPGVDDVNAKDIKVARRSRHSIGYAGDYRHHAFQHVNVPIATNASPTTGALESPTSSPTAAPHSPLSWQTLGRVQPHLPKQLEEDAKRCFLYHAQHINLEVDDTLGVVRRRELRSADGFTLDDNGDNAPPTEDDNQQQTADKYLDLDELEKAVMDLGVFPSHEEIETMHSTLARGTAAYVDLDEFLEMIRALKLAPIGRSAKRELYKMYRRVCDKDGLLSRQNLSQLMTSLGHPEDEVELEKLMHDWDIKGQGSLDFDAFISIVSSTLKAEEIQVQCENDFKRFNPNVSEAASGKGGDADELLNYHITVDDLIRVYSELGVVLTAQIAEEMLFDADISGDGGVAYDDLMTCIETIGTHEVYHAMETNRTGLRAIQEAKIGEQYRSAVDEHGAAAQIGDDYDGSTAPMQLPNELSLTASSHSSPALLPSQMHQRNNVFDSNAAGAAPNGDGDAPSRADGEKDKQQ